MSNNNLLFPIIIWKVRIRDFDNEGLFANIDCATNVKTTISTSETKELVCWSWQSLTLEKPSGSITLKVIKTKNPDLIWKLLNLNVLTKQSGANNLVDVKVTFAKDGVIEMLERSNDWNWITGITVKSLDKAVTYVKDTDFTVEVIDNKTIIKKKWSKIPEGTTVLVSGTINQNWFKQVEIARLQRAKKKFSIELYGEDQTTGKLTMLYATPVELDSEYVLEMIDAFRDGDIAWSELTFKLSDGWKITYTDENI